jgi:hypothetical protein
VYAKTMLQAGVTVGEPGQESGSQFASGRLVVHLQSPSRHPRFQIQVPKRDGSTVLVAWEVAESEVAILVGKVMNCSHL